MAGMTPSLLVVSLYLKLHNFDIGSRPMERWKLVLSGLRRTAIIGMVDLPAFGPTARFYFAL